SYTGKGIYDIDAFELALAGKVRENTLLSHDLFEGVFARAALATDIELIEEFPSHYEASAARQHRWARGDWQLLPWIFGNDGKSRGSSARVHISAISRWKMLDNLRRTLSAPSMFLTMVAGWLVTSISPWLWTLFILIMIAVPALIPFLGRLNFHLHGVSKRSYFRGILHDLWLGVAQFGLSVIFLSYQAWLMSDAIIRTLIRRCITRRNLLEWVTAAQAKRGVNRDFLGIYRRMAGGVILGIAALLAVIFVRHQAVVISLPFVLLWLSAPAVARWISLSPRRLEAEPLTRNTVRAIRLASRRTWRFFERFVREDEHFLPPDNFQEDPKPIVAHRTSPTNIGLYLLCNLAARELGWIGTGEALGRIEETLGTMSKLEMFRGHFYNWYDTRDLHPLDPRYISSVDSGNLAGHLLALANGCRELIHGATLDARIFAGLEDDIVLLRGALLKAGDLKRTHTVT
ncbi:MAG: glycosyl transferase, partial [Candidatus Dormibacteria bacterium]